MQIRKNKIAFTLIEIMFWILIVSWVLIVAFDVVSKVSIWKIKLIDSANIEKETFFFSQRLFETIKKWWTIDYEEYFDRKIVWANTYSSWHYSKNTGFWNFWKWGNIWTTTYWNDFYYCRSSNWWTQMWTWWCVITNNNDNWRTDWSPNNNIDYSWTPQRYWEYSFQFIDYNSNADNDLWDEDWDKFIIWDDDDEYLWNWPVAFTWGTNVRELYLISADKKTRTLLRLNYVLDPNRPNGSNCSSSDSWSTYTWTWCLWQIEMLKLSWEDWWMDHSIWTIDTNWTQYDWVIDTWLINKDFVSDWSVVVAWSNNTNYWLPLFSNNVNVLSFKIYPYPNKDVNRAWKDNSVKTNISPYVRLEVTLAPSWKIKKRIKWKIPEFKYSTTISLSGIYSRAN